MLNTKEFGDRSVNALPAIIGFLIVSGFKLPELLGPVVYPLMYWGTLALSIGIICYAVMGLFTE